MNIKCPRCQSMTVYNEDNLFRPFCSKRCQVIDTAAWADENYAIPTDERPSDESFWQNRDESNFQ